LFSQEQNEKSIVILNYVANVILSITYLLNIFNLKQVLDDFSGQASKLGPKLRYIAKLILYKPYAAAKTRNAYHFY